jgi:hypothetical protein
MNERDRKELKNIINNFLKGGSFMNSVSQETCTAKHTGVDKDLIRIEKKTQKNEEEIGTVQDAVLLLSQIVNRLSKRAVVDKIIMILAILILIVILTVIFGPETVARIINK